MKHSLLSIIVFIAIICGIIIGGNYLIKNGTTVEEDSSSNKKIDDKEYVYFTNETVISNDLDVIYKDININIDSDEVTSLEEKLNNNMNNIRNSYIKLSSINIDTNDIIYEVEDDIYEASFIKYDVLESKEYISILVYSGIINITKDDNLTTTKVYTISKKNGNILSNEDILSISGISNDTLNNVLSNYDDVISSYTLYFDKYQYVYAVVLVENEDLTYNDNIKIN